MKIKDLWIDASIDERIARGRWWKATPREEIVQIQHRHRCVSIRDSLLFFVEENHLPCVDLVESTFARIGSFFSQELKSVNFIANKHWRQDLETKNDYTIHCYITIQCKVSIRVTDFYLIVIWNRSTLSSSNSVMRHSLTKRMRKKKNVFVLHQFQLHSSLWKRQRCRSNRTSHYSLTRSSFSSRQLRKIKSFLE